MTNCYFQKYIAALFCAFLVWGSNTAYADVEQRQTNINQATHSTNQNGVPRLAVEGLGVVEHPAWTALYALAYAGAEDYDPSLGLKVDVQRFEACIAWLKANLSKNRQGQWVWQYYFDSTYNDVTIKAPWSSAFAQATGIQALLLHWRRTRDQSSLEVAKKAAQSLFVSLKDGGFLFNAGEDIWFEEIPVPEGNPTHILNGHMRVLLALAELKAVSGEDGYEKWFKKGVNTLVRWLPMYDTGYWLRYDLNPRKDELLFRFANPYGFANPELAIDRVALRDPLSGEEFELDIGGVKDAEGPLRIAGNDWGPPEQVGARSVRRLRPVEHERATLGAEGKMLAPHSYFYLKLPGRWTDNLRKTPYELSVEYLDERAGNLEVQVRSIAPGGETFRRLKDGDLLISGEKVWRKWRINISGSDLGYWVGGFYAEKHKDYLRSLARYDEKLKPWVEISTAYLRSVNSGERYDAVDIAKTDLPRQTPSLPIYSLDKDGVLMMNLSSSETKFNSRGGFDFSSDEGVPVYSPYIVAHQLIEGAGSSRAAYVRGAKTKIRRDPALRWFRNPKNQYPINDGVVFSFLFANVYNDVVTTPPWPSAFSQAYVLKGLGYALKKMGEGRETEELLRKSAYAYNTSVAQGGVSSFDKTGAVFFEEVPNATHVLNAHLVSIPMLSEAADVLQDARVRSLVTAGIETLRNKLSLYDTGYWLRYDLNPKKEFLFQLDWLAGNTSPLIESVSLEAPQHAKRNHLHVGDEQVFAGASRLSGKEWLPVQAVDGRQVRTFANGYLKHREDVKGGTRHNVYILMQSPVSQFFDYFDVQPFRLMIRYKDIAPGKFVVKLQSINEGNSLKFTPLRNSVIATVGDQQWKVAAIEMLPQDMGWYKGQDYQTFEVDQLDAIAKLTGDWYFRQSAERQRYFLSAKRKELSPIVEPAVTPFNMPNIGLSLLKSSPTYSGFGFDNALDGDSDDDYVAGLENEKNAYVEVSLEKPVQQALLELKWESASNRPSKIRVLSVNEGGKSEELASKFVEDGEGAKLEVAAKSAFQHLRIEFFEPKGQPRVLLRLLTLRETAPSAAITH